MSNPTIDYSLDTALLANLLRTALNEGKQPRLTVVSGSMSPLLEVGDQVVLGAASAEILAPGDIIVLAENHDTLTHRYWRQTEKDGQTWLITRGDRPAGWDPPHRADDLIGRVVARIRDNVLLPIDSGAGAVANNHLTRIAAFDNRLLVRTDTRPLVQRLLRRLIRTYAALRLRLAL